MPTHSLTRRFTVLAVATSIVFGAAACTGSPEASDSTVSTDGSDSTSNWVDAQGDEGQSTDEACALVQDTITSATDDFDVASEDDPSAVVDAMQAAADQLAELTPDVTNDEVAAIVPSLETLFRQIGDSMNDILNGDTESLEELDQLGADYQATIAQFQALCTP
ncbi:hypothetical protein [Microbacterium sp. NPDC076911]|uniref:hypothetical protein n=1 Tax=Microbacterium sp. NPDC076911 TaxID=3154958 RepID=UPI00343B799C